MKEFTLPSGAILKVTLSSFSVSRGLYQAMLDEVKKLKLDPDDEVEINLIKDIFCSAFSSKKIEEALSECMKKATYNGLKIDENTFEPEEARGDYLIVCMEVARVNVLPFTKSLFAELKVIMEKVRAFTQA